MNGIDPWAFMQDLAGRIDGLTERAAIEEALLRISLRAARERLRTCHERDTR